MVTASGLLGLPPGAHSELDFFVTPALLADLYASDLVITPSYVGPERAAGAGVPLSQLQQWDVDVPGRRPAGSLRLIEGILIALVSAAYAVPLTLLLAH